jgi:hypothetical protein
LSRSVIPASAQSTQSASLFESHRDECGRFAAVDDGIGLSGRAAVDLHAAISTTADSSAHEDLRAGFRHPVVTS